MKITIKTH